MWPSGENPGTHTLTEWTDPCCGGSRTQTFINVGSFQFVSALPLKSQTLSLDISFNFKMGALFFSAIDMCIIARVVSSTGATVATIGSLIDQQGPVCDNAHTAPASVTGTILASSTSVSKGDYLVVEIGYYHWPASASANRVHWEFGDDHASDLVGTGDTTGRPWIEFGDTIRFDTGYDYIVESEAMGLGIGIE